MFSEELKQRILDDVVNKPESRLIDIAASHGVSAWTVHRLVKENGVQRKRGIGSRAFRVHCVDEGVLRG